MLDRENWSLRPPESRRDALRRAGTAAVLAAGVVMGVGTAESRAQQATPVSTGRPPLPPDFKVVLHAAEPGNWTEVLSNLRNLTQEWPQAQIRVVIDGPAVLTLQGANVVTDELARAYAAGVLIQVCPNALRDQGIDAATIPAYAQTTLGGVLALVLAQHEGFAYVKP